MKTSDGLILIKDALPDLKGLQAKDGPAIHGDPAEDLYVSISAYASHVHKVSLADWIKANIEENDSDNHAKNGSESDYSFHFGPVTKAQFTGDAHQTPFEDLLMSGIFPTDQSLLTDVMAGVFTTAFNDYLKLDSSTLINTLSHLPAAAEEIAPPDFFNLTFKQLFDVLVNEGGADADTLAQQTRDSGVFSSQTSLQDLLAADVYTNGAYAVRAGVTSDAKVLSTSSSTDTGGSTVETITPIDTTVTVTSTPVESTPTITTGPPAGTGSLTLSESSLPVGSSPDPSGTVAYGIITGPPVHGDPVTNLTISAGASPGSSVTEYSALSAIPTSILTSSELSALLMDWHSTIPVGTMDSLGKDNSAQATDPVWVANDGAGNYFILDAYNGQVAEFMNAPINQTINNGVEVFTYTVVDASNVSHTGTETITLESDIPNPQNIITGFSGGGPDTGGSTGVSTFVAVQEDPSSLGITPDSALEIFLPTTEDPASEPFNYLIPLLDPNYLNDASLNGVTPLSVNQVFGADIYASGLSTQPVEVYDTSGVAEKVYLPAALIASASFGGLATYLPVSDNPDSANYVLSTSPSSSSGVPSGVLTVSMTLDQFWNSLSSDIVSSLGEQGITEASAFSLFNANTESFANVNGNDSMLVIEDPETLMQVIGGVLQSNTVYNDLVIDEASGRYLYFQNHGYNNNSGYLDLPGYTNVTYNYNISVGDASIAASFIVQVTDDNFISSLDNLNFSDENNNTFITPTFTAFAANAGVGPGIAGDLFPLDANNKPTVNFGLDGFGGIQVSGSLTDITDLSTSSKVYTFVNGDSQTYGTIVGSFGTLSFNVADPNFVTDTGMNATDAYFGSFAYTLASSTSNPYGLPDLYYLQFQNGEGQLSSWYEIQVSLSSAIGSVASITSAEIEGTYLFNVFTQGFGLTGFDYFSGVSALPPTIATGDLFPLSLNFNSNHAVGGVQVESDLAVQTPQNLNESNLSNPITTYSYLLGAGDHSQPSGTIAGLYGSLQLNAADPNFLSSNAYALDDNMGTFIYTLNTSIANPNDNPDIFYIQYTNSNGTLSDMYALEFQFSTSGSGSNYVSYVALDDISSVTIMNPSIEQTSLYGYTNATGDLTPAIFAISPDGNGTIVVDSSNTFVNNPTQPDFEFSSTTNTSISGGQYVEIAGQYGTFFYNISDTNFASDVQNAIGAINTQQGTSFQAGSPDNYLGSFDYVITSFEPNNFSAFGSADNFYIQYTNDNVTQTYELSFQVSLPDNVGAPLTVGSEYVSQIITPVVLNFGAEQSINLVSAADSNVTLGMLNGSSDPSHIGWIGADSGILVYNPEHTATITNINQIDFASYLPGANTDLQGLEAFDVNHTGVLNASDPTWGSFDVWVVNSNGTGQMESLASLGITSISLASNDVTQTVAGNTIFGTSTYTTSNGQTNLVGDVGLTVQGGESIPLSPGDVLNTGASVNLTALLGSGSTSGAPSSSAPVTVQVVAPGGVHESVTLTAEQLHILHSFHG